MANTGKLTTGKGNKSISICQIKHGRTPENGVYLLSLLIPSL